MIFGLSLISVVSVLMLLLRKDKKKMIIVVFSVLFFIMAVRGQGVGEDYTNYKVIFLGYKNIDWFSSLFQLEGFYGILNKVIVEFTGSYQVLLIISSFMSLIGVAWYIYVYSEKPWLSIWLFITLWSYENMFTRIRQSIAFSFLLVAFDAAKNKRFKRFLLFVFIASMFHITAIVAIVIYPLMNMKINTISIFVITIGLAVLYLIRPYVFQVLTQLFSDTKYSAYTEQTSGGTSLMIVFWLMYIFLIIVNKLAIDNNHMANLIKDDSEKKEKSARMDEARLMYVLCSAALFFQTLATFSATINRIGVYFFDAVSLESPNTIKSFKESNKLFVTAAIVGVSLLYFVYYIVTTPNRSILGYHFFWQDP